MKDFSGINIWGNYPKSLREMYYNSYEYFKEDCQFSIVKKQEFYLPEGSPIFTNNFNPIEYENTISHYIIAMSFELIAMIEYINRTVGFRISIIHISSDYLNMKPVYRIEASSKEENEKFKKALDAYSYLNVMIDDIWNHSLPYNIYIMILGLLNEAKNNGEITKEEYEYYDESRACDGGCLSLDFCGENSARIAYKALFGVEYSGKISFDEKFNQIALESLTNMIADTRFILSNTDIDNSDTISDIDKLLNSINKKETQNE